MKFIPWIMMSVLLVSCNETKKTRILPAAPSTEAAQGSSSILSQLHRIKGTAILTVSEESSKADSLPVGYDNIPRLEESDDGISSNSVTLQTRPLVECGTAAGLTTAQRLRDCLDKNPAHSEWKGVTNGNAGEGVWKLFTRNSLGREIWMDEKTGLVWSDILTTNSGANLLANWCQASGNKESALIANGVDCNDLGTVSRCESATVMGIAPSDVSWRLPTRGDYLQADINGARFVLPRTNQQVWMATVSSQNREQALMINLQNGVISTIDRDQQQLVRCVGRRLK